jgi:hypothetical protein
MPKAKTVDARNKVVSFIKVLTEFLLMSVASQALLSLVPSHLAPLTLPATRHIFSTPSHQKFETNMIGYQDIRRSGSRLSGDQDIRFGNFDKFFTWYPDSLISCILIT